MLRLAEQFRFLGVSPSFSAPSVSFRFAFFGSRGGDNSTSHPFVASPRIVQQRFSRALLDIFSARASRRIHMLGNAYKSSALQLEAQMDHTYHRDLSCTQTFG